MDGEPDMNEDADIARDDLGDDDALLARLGGIAATVDPVPELVTRAGYAALSTRRLDEELAELLMDSELVEAGRLRAAGDRTRVLSFATETVSLELQVEGDGEQKALRGFVSGVAGEVRIDVVIENATQSQDVSVDDEGWFVLTPIPSGALRVRLTTGTGAAITPWFHP
jgi:hypothetical protein